MPIEAIGMQWSDLNDEEYKLGGHKEAYKICHCYRNHETEPNVYEFQTGTSEDDLIAFFENLYSEPRTKYRITLIQMEHNVYSADRHVIRIGDWVAEDLDDQDRVKVRRFVKAKA